MSNIPKHLLDSIIMSKEQWEEYKSQKRQIEIMERYFELICDIGYDYDGYNKADNLKKVIDNLVHYASLGRVANDTEIIYTDGKGINENILFEKIDKKD